MLYTTLRRRIMTRWFVSLWPSWIEMITKLCVGIKGIFSFLQLHKKYNKCVPRSSATPWLMESSGIMIYVAIDRDGVASSGLTKLWSFEIIAVPSIVVWAIAALRLGRSKSRLSVLSLWSKTINCCRTWYITVYFVDITLSLCRVCGKTYELVKF